MAGGSLGLRTNPALTLFLSLALVHSPILLVYGVELAGREHYYFFSAIWLVLAMLVSHMGGAVSGVRWQTVVLLIADGTLIAIASVWGSPWLGYVGFCLGCTAILMASENDWEGGSLLRLGVLPLLALRPPLNLDISMATGLRAWMIHSASAILDRLDVVHYWTGTVLYLPNTLSLDCGARAVMPSVLNMFSLAVLVVVLERRHWLVSILQLAAAAWWAVSLKVVHLTTIAVALAEYEVDLAAGCSAVAVDVLLIAVFLVCLFSTDRFLLLCTLPIPISTLEVEEDGDDNRLVTYFNRFFQSHADVRPLSATAFACFPTRFRGRAILAIILVCLVAAQALGLIFSYALPWRRAAGPPSDAGGQQAAEGASCPSAGGIRGETRPHGDLRLPFILVRHVDAGWWSGAGGPL
jgi:hypothetical protein